MMSLKTSLYADPALKAGNGIVRTISNYGLIRSSAGGLSCSLKWGNLRNPHHMFYLSYETARDNREEGGDDAKSAWPFDVLGCTHGTMASTMGCQAVTWS